MPYCHHPNSFFPGRGDSLSSPLPSSSLQRSKGGSTNAHPDLQPPHLAWRWQTHSTHSAGAQTTRVLDLVPQSQAGTGRELSSAGKNPQRIRNPHRMVIEREERPTGSPPHIWHPGTQASGSPTPPSLESQVPSPGNEPSHTEEMNFISINTGATPIQGQLKEGLGPQRN